MKLYRKIELEILNLGIDEDLPEFKARLKNCVKTQSLENIGRGVSADLKSAFLEFLEKYPEHRAKILK